MQGNNNNNNYLFIYLLFYFTYTYICCTARCWSKSKINSGSRDLATETTGIIYEYFDFDVYIYK